jgi:hypothetical protein
VGAERSCRLGLGVIAHSRDDGGAITDPPSVSLSSPRLPGTVDEDSQAAHGAVGETAR